MAKNLRVAAVVDLEATCWASDPGAAAELGATYEPRPEGARNEVIEIGYCLARKDPKTGRWSASPADSGSVLIMPESPVSSFCMALTGHTPEALQEHGGYLHAVELLRANVPKLVYMPWLSWGDYDRELMASSARFHFPELPEPIREAHYERAKGRSTHATLDSLVAHANRNKVTGSAAWLNVESNVAQLTVVYDYNEQLAQTAQGARPNWCRSWPSVSRCSNRSTASAPLRRRARDG